MISASSAAIVGEAPQHHVLLVAVPRSDATSLSQTPVRSNDFELTDCRTVVQTPTAGAVPTTAVLDVTVGGHDESVVQSTITRDGAVVAGACAVDVDAMRSGPLVVDGVDVSLARASNASAVCEPLSALLERTAKDVGTVMASAAIVVVSPLRGTPATFTPGRATQEAELASLWSPFSQRAATAHPQVPGYTTGPPSTAAKLMLLLQAAWARRGLGTRCSLVGWDALGRTRDLLDEHFPPPRRGGGGDVTDTFEAFEGTYGPDGRAPSYAAGSAAAPADEFPTLRAVHLHPAPGHGGGGAGGGELDTGQLRAADASRLIESARWGFVQGAQRIAQTAGASPADTRWALGLRIEATRPDGSYCGGGGSVWLFEVTPAALTVPLDTRRHGIVAPPLVSSMLAVAGVPAYGAAPLLSAAAVSERPDLSLALAVVGGAQCARRVTLVSVVPSTPAPPGSDLARAAWRALAGCATLQRRVVTCPVLPAPNRDASALAHLYVSAVDELRRLRARHLRAIATGTTGDEASVRGQDSDSCVAPVPAAVEPAVPATRRGAGPVVVQVDPIRLFPFRAWSLALRQRLAVVEDEEAQSEHRARVLDRYHKWLLSAGHGSAGHSHPQRADGQSSGVTATAEKFASRSAADFGSGSLAAAAQPHGASNINTNQQVAVLEVLAAQEHAELLRLRRWLSADTERLSAELQFLRATAPTTSGTAAAADTRRADASRAGSPTTAAAVAGTFDLREGAGTPHAGAESHDTAAAFSADPLVAAFAALEDDFTALTDATFPYAVRPTSTTTVATERRRLARLALRRFVADVEGVIDGAQFAAAAPLPIDAAAQQGGGDSGISDTVTWDHSTDAIARTHAALLARRNFRESPAAMGVPEAAAIAGAAGALELISVASTMRRCADMVVSCAATAAAAMRRNDARCVAAVPDLAASTADATGPAMATLSAALAAAGAHRAPSPRHRSVAPPPGRAVAVEPRGASPLRGRATSGGARTKPKRPDLFDSAGIDTEADRMAASRSTAAALLHVEWLAASAAALSATAAGAVAAATGSFQDTMGVVRSDASVWPAHGAVTATPQGLGAARADAFSREVSLLCAGHSLRRRQTLSGGDADMHVPPLGGGVTAVAYPTQASAADHEHHVSFAPTQVSGNTVAIRRSGSGGVKNISVDPFSGAVRTETDRGAVLSVQLGRVLHAPDPRSGRFDGVRPSAAVTQQRQHGAAAANVSGRDALAMSSGVRRGVFSQQQAASALGGRTRTPVGPRVGR